MQIDQIVRPAAAEIITITTLRAGDVYKRLQKEPYGERWQVFLGIVQTVMHNGTDCAFTAFEVNGITNEVKHVGYGTGADLALFPATVEEAHSILAAARDEAVRNFEQRERELLKARDLLALTDSVIARANDITAPAVTAIPGA